ncbi:MAG: DUF4249 family protein [Bacteroidales bacterium]
MRVSRGGSAVVLAGILCVGCVETYSPSEGEGLAGSLVVSAHLTDRPGVQTITLSRSDRLLYPTFLAEEGALVSVEDEEGHLLSFDEEDPGAYEADIPEGFMRTGSSYRLRLVTRDGESYLSDYSTLYPAVPIDSLYWELESMATGEPDVYLEGIRFFMDFTPRPDPGRAHAVKSQETYEYHNPNYTGYIYDIDRGGPGSCPTA